MTTKTRTSKPIVRAICYQRISEDGSGEEAGVTRQAKDTKAFCARKGWTVVANLTDNDLSASRYARKRRPGYQDAIRLIEAGEADALVSYNLDRLWRQPKELEYLIDLVETRHITVATLTGDIDLMTGEGRLQARLLVSVAAMESDNASRRIRRQKDEMAADGIPLSGFQGLGYNRARMVVKGEEQRAGMVIVETEAKAIRDGARRFLAGESLNSIARGWNEQGLATVQGGRGWDGSKVRAVLANPRNAGLMYRRGEYVGKAAWPAIISETSWRRIMAALDDPSRQQAPKRTTLLTGLVYCGKCGNGLTRNFLKDGRPVLACRRRVGSDAGCNGIVITADPFEELVVEAVLLALDSPALDKAAKRTATKSADADLTEAARLEDDLALRLEMLDNGEITRSEYLTSTKRLKGRLDSLRRRQATVNHTAAAQPYRDQPGLLRKRWPKLTLDEKRSVLAAVIDRITVAPAARRGPGLDPERVSILWRV